MSVFFLLFSLANIRDKFKQMFFGEGKFLKAGSASFIICNKISNRHFFFFLAVRFKRSKRMNYLTVGYRSFVHEICNLWFAPWGYLLNEIMKTIKTKFNFSISSRAVMKNRLMVRLRKSLSIANNLKLFFVGSFVTVSNKCFTLVHPTALLSITSEY